MKGSSRQSGRRRPALTPACRLRDRLRRPRHVVLGPCLKGALRLFSRGAEIPPRRRFPIPSVCRAPTRTYFLKDKILSFLAPTSAPSVMSPEPATLLTILGLECTLPESSWASYSSTLRRKAANSAGSSNAKGPGPEEAGEGRGEGRRILGGNGSWDPWEKMGFS